MGVRFPSVASNTFVGPLPVGNAETAILTTPPLNISLDFSQILILWSCSITAGTGVTQLNYRIRRGVGIAGAAVTAAIWVHTLAAAVTAIMSGWYFDTPGAVAGQQYTLTVSQQGSTAASNFLDGAMLAFAL